MLVDTYPVYVVACDLNFLYGIFNLVPRALFPGFGGQGKTLWGRGWGLNFASLDLFLRVFNFAIFFTISKNAKFSTSKVTAEQNA